MKGLNQTDSSWFYLARFSQYSFPEYLTQALNKRPNTGFKFKAFVDNLKFTILVSSPSVSPNTCEVQSMLWFSKSWSKNWLFEARLNHFQKEHSYHKTKLQFFVFAKVKTLDAVDIFRKATGEMKDFIGKNCEKLSFESLKDPLCL